VLAVAGELGVPAAQVALAWLLERNQRSATALVPVTGPRNLAQLEDYLAALDVRLDDDQYRRLDETSRIPLGQPHDLNNSRRAPSSAGTPTPSSHPWCRWPSHCSKKRLWSRRLRSLASGGGGGGGGGAPTFVGGNCRYHRR
jgi:hypothetical protein